MADLYKYGVAVHFCKSLVKRGVVDLAVSVDWTPAAGDVKISKDGGAAANVTNLPTAITMGNTALWDFSLTATEMQAAKIRITISDSATKAVEDVAFEIDTYGNASAQHAVDFTDAVRFGLTALPNAAAEAAGGLYTRGTGAGQVNQPANGMIDTNVVRNAGTAITSAAGVQEVKVQSIAANAITATSINADAITAAKVADGTIDAATFAAGAINAAAIADGAIDDAAVAADMDSYTARIGLLDDDGGSADRYDVAWFKNSTWIRSGITLPTIQVVKTLDGSELVATTAMTEISSLHLFKKTESTNRVVDGASYWAIARATIDGSVREWPQVVGRDG